MGIQVIKSTGPTAGGGSSHITGAPSVTALSYLYGTADADGRIYVDVRATVAAGSGSATGANAWLQLPDSFGAATLSLELGTSELGAEWAPVFVGWVKYGDELRFSFPAPDAAQFARLYLVPGTEDRDLKPVEKGRAGESPSYQFTVEPPPGVAVGREFAPNVLNVTGSIEYDLTSSSTGTPMWRARIDWDWPINDEGFNALGGVTLRLNDGDPNTEDYSGSAGVEQDATTGSLTTPWQEVPDPPKLFRAELISYSTSGRDNSYQTGITPTLLLSVARPSGGTGAEYTPNAALSGAGFSITSTSLSDGTKRLRVQVDFTAPSDSRFGGVNVAVKRPSDTAARTIGGGRTSPVEIEIGSPASIETWRFYLVSVGAADGKQNTIVDGITPYQDKSVGSTANELNLAKSTNFAADRLAITSGALDIKTGSIGTAYLTTSQIDVGGGGSKPIRLRIFDALAALIGWIGDDTGVSGYVGAWFKQLRIGGSSPANAKITADSSGAVTITDAPLTLTQNGVRTKVANETVSGGVAGLVVEDNPTITATARMLPGAVELTGSTGTLRARLDMPSSGRLSLYDNTGAEKTRLTTGSLYIGGPIASSSQLSIVDGIVDFRAGTATSANGGSVSPPANVVGYINAKVNGVDVRIPYYNS